jgi:hypothetical protein
MTATTGPCRNCAAPLSNAYCSACGQKRFSPADRTIASLAGDAFVSVFNFDNRVWRTLHALLLRPGVLSRDYLDGRRARWLSPITVLLLVSLVYFLAPPVTDFSLPFRAQVHGTLALESDGHAMSAQERAAYANWGGQHHSRWTTPWVAARIAALEAASGGEFTAADFAAAYDSKNAEISKLIVGLHIPFLALALVALFPRRDMYFAEHLVVATHLFCVLVLIAEIAAVGFRLVSVAAPAATEQFAPFLPLLSMTSGVLIVISWSIAVRRVYAVPRWRTALTGFGLLFAFATIHLYVFRTVQFLLIALLV